MAIGALNMNAYDIYDGDTFKRQATAHDIGKIRLADGRTVNGPSDAQLASVGILKRVVEDVPDDHVEIGTRTPHRDGNLSVWKPFAVVPVAQYQSARVAEIAASHAAGHIASLEAFAASIGMSIAASDNGHTMEEIAQGALTAAAAARDSGDLATALTITMNGTALSGAYAALGAEGITDKDIFWVIKLQALENE